MNEKYNSYHHFFHEIQTHYMDRNNDAISVYIEYQSPFFRIHDAGETITDLEMRGLEFQDAHVSKAIYDVLRRHNLSITTYKQRNSDLFIIDTYNHFDIDKMITGILEIDLIERGV